MLIWKVLILANNDIGLYSFRLEIIEHLWQVVIFYIVKTIHV